MAGSARRLRGGSPASWMTQRGPAARGSSVRLATGRPSSDGATAGAASANGAGSRSKATPRTSSFGRATMTNPDTVQNSIGTMTSHPSHMCQRRKLARNVIDHPLVTRRHG